MNNKGIKQIKMYIILVIILIIALIAIFYLVESNKDSSSARPLTTSSVSKTTLLTDLVNNENDNKNNNNHQNNEQTNLVATPFSAPLSDIIYGYEFDGDYKISINYNNVIFDFNCNNYNGDELACVEGSGLMRYNDLVIPLYTYTDSINNILNFAEDFYIDMQGDYIFLTSNHVGVSSGKTLIYNTQGNLIGEVNNVVTGYILNDRKYNVLYPNYSDQELTFYYVQNGIIKIGYVDVTDSKRISEIEIVPGAVLS